MRCDMQFLEQGEGTGFRACVLCWVEIGEGERVRYTSVTAYNSFCISLVRAVCGCCREGCACRLSVRGAAVSRAVCGRFAREVSFLIPSPQCGRKIAVTCTGGSFTFTRASKIIDLAAEGQRGPAKPRSAASTAAAGAGDATEWPACVTSGAVDVRLTSIMNGAMRGSFH